MADIQTSLPIKITDATVTDVVGISTIGLDKALKVDVIQTVSGSQVDKSSFVEGTTTFSPVGGVYNETISSDPTEDQAAAARITAKRALHVNLRDASGAEFGTVSNPLVISSDSIYAEDSAHSGGDVGNFILGLRNDTQTTLTSTDGDYSPISVDKSGNVHVVEANVADGLVHYFNTVTTVGNNATGTITYTVTTGKTFYLKQVIASSSGAPSKVTVDYGSGPTTLFVGFYSTTSPVLDVTFAQPVKIAASTAVNVKITNRGGASQDVYATIIGVEI